MKNTTHIKQWLARLDYFNNEFPFGPMQEFRDELGRLHRDDGPALITPTRCIWYREGRKHGMDVTKFGSMHFYYENRAIPSRWFYKPEELTFNEILENPNQELRYVGMKIYGLDRACDEGLFDVIHEDKNKQQMLIRIKLSNQLIVSYVKVVNSTPEPDGSYKNYFLCVPPTMRTCKEAVAWTFRCEENNYNPITET